MVKSASSQFNSQKGQEVLPVMTSWISEWRVGRPGRGPAAHIFVYIFTSICTNLVTMLEQHVLTDRGREAEPTLSLMPSRGRLLWPNEV